MPSIPNMSRSRRTLLLFFVGASRKPAVIDFVDGTSPCNLQEAHQLGIKNVWFQPGTYDEAVKEKAKELGMNTVYDCVLVQLGKSE